MQTSKERAMQFKKELKALLKKWNTEIELEEEYTQPYGCSTYTMMVYLPYEYDKNGDCIAESATIKLGSYYDSN